MEDLNKLIEKLSDKQKRFIIEYFIDFNATQAALRAGYSEKSAYQSGWKLVRDPEISEILNLKSKDLLEASKVEKLDIINDLLKIKDLNMEKKPGISIKAIEQLNKMLGFNEVEKLNIFNSEQPLFGEE